MQEAEEFLHTIEKVLEQYARAMLHISRGYALQEEEFQVLTVCHGGASDTKDPWNADVSSSTSETLVARAPKWNQPIAAPACWTPTKARALPTIFINIAEE